MGKYTGFISSTTWLRVAVITSFVLCIQIDGGQSENEDCDLDKHPEGCRQEFCSSLVPSTCVRGVCQNGVCHCNPCWEGSKCDQYVNKHAPTLQSINDITISRGQLYDGSWPTDSVLGYAIATDEDRDARCSTGDCTCADVIYSVHERGGKESEILKIDNHGAIRIHDRAKLFNDPSSMHRMTIRASNEDDLRYSEGDFAVIVEVDVDMGTDGDDDEPHQRFRRTVADEDMTPVNENNTIEFEFGAASEEANGTDLQAGIKVLFRLTMNIPSGTYAEDVKIELYAEEGNFTFGILCPPSVTHAGSNINYETATPSYDFDADNPFMATGAYLSLGNVTNNNASIADGSSSITIEFALTVLNDTRAGFSDSELRWITAGVEFANGALLWVGQLGYYLQAAPTENFNQPAVNIAPPTGGEINKLDFGVFTLSMNIYDYSSDVTVYVYGSPDTAGVASICGVGLRSHGDGFCLQNYDVLASYVTDDAYETNKEAVFPFNSIINGGTRNSVSHSEIVMDVIVRLPSNSIAVTDNSYTVGVSAVVNDVVKNASTTFIAKDEDPTLTAGGSFYINQAEVEVTEVIAGGSFPVKFKLGIPTAGKFDLTLESTITSPAGPTPSMCRAIVTSSGYNLPCIASTCPDCRNDVTATDAQLTSSINLGVIRNENMRTDSSENKVKYNVWVGIPADVATGSMDVDFTLKSAGTVVAGPNTISLNVISGIPADQDGNSLSFTTNLDCGNPCTLANGATGTLRVTTTVPPTSTFSNIKFEFTSQLLAGVDRVGLCEARLSSAAAELGCLPYATNDILPTITSTGGSSLINDKLVFETGVVSNMDPNATGDFVVEILLRRMEIDAADAAARSIDISVFVNGASSASYTDSYTIDGTTDLASWDVPAATFPVTLELSPTSPSDAAVAPGTFASVTITLTFEKDTSYAYTLNVDVNTAALNIISLTGDVGGDADLPCGDPVFADATLTSLNADKTNQQATLELGVISASVTSSSTVNLTLVVQLSGDRTAIADASTHSINVDVQSFSDASLATGSIDITADYSADAALTTVIPSPHEVAYTTVTSQDIEIGKYSSFTQSFTVANETELGYSLQLSSNASWFEFTDINIVSIGEHVEAFTTPDLAPDPALPGTTLSANLGFIHCSGTDCQIEFRVTVKALNDSGAVHGDVVQMDAQVTVTTGSSQVQDIKSLIFFAINSTVIRNYTSTFALNCPDTSVKMTPGERALCNITISVTDQDVQSEVEVLTTLNISYVGMVIRSMAVIEVGSQIVSNLGDLTALAPTFTSYVNANTTQKDRAKLSLGLLHNNDVDNASPDDPDHQIVIDVEIQMTDSEEVVDGVLQILSAGVALDAAYVWASNLYIEASRTGNELAQLGITFMMLGDTSSLGNGDMVTYRIGLNHSTTSSSECSNVELRLFLPPYIEYQSIGEDDTHDASYPIIVDTSSGLTFQTMKLYFTDLIVFDVVCMISPSYIFKGKMDWDAISTLQVSYTTFDRSGPSVVDGPAIVDFADAAYSLTASSSESTSSIPTAVCATPTNLGVEDGTVADCQISASSEPNSAAAAKHGRLNGIGWLTEARAGDYLHDRYLKIDLGRKVALSGLSTQGGARAATLDHPAFQGDIGKFEVMYSTDDVVYRKARSDDGTFEFDHAKVYITASSTLYYDRISEHNFDSPVEARYVIIRLTQYNFTAAGHLYNVLRTELHGCPLEAMQTDVCEQTTLSLPEEYDRGVLIDSTSQDAYICDTKTHEKSGLRRQLDSQTLVINNKDPMAVCSLKRASSTPNTWSVLPSQVRQVIGYSQADDTLYAIGRDSTAAYYMKSVDGGVSWTPISPSVWQATVAMTTPTTKVPLQPVDGLNYGVFSTDPQQDARFDGIYSGDTTPIKWVSWNQCCQKECYLEGYTQC